ncbi:phosphatase PAP2 family protein [Bradyrhizobium sp. CCBAU 53338]|uniref:phosphatase PAP2 family protein n=1 Tax=Bradyrhizobium sp. CCBAU 53338 TaxID=1325111 RepID=UPI00188B07D9|nr:phosphatase PAP2 family protein [Bradyrhizobium sp. CCBAU 53338]QOZ52215.1 hypothetical protein XH90_13160 [Bradyrhizobium sp. CCBAU 53338]
MQFYIAEHIDLAILKSHFGEDVNNFLRWSLLAGIAVIDFFLSRLVGVHIIVERWALLLGLLLLGIFVIYRFVRKRPRIACLCHAVMQYLALTGVMVILSCIVATFDRPLIDAELSRVDQALGLDWTAAFDFVHSHPLLSVILRSAYSSIPVQTALLFWWLAVIADDFARIDEFIGLVASTLVLTVAISAVLPAGGAFVWYKQTSVTDASYVQLFLDLRGGAIHEIPLSQLDGIVQFPSFHMIFGIICIYAARGVRVLFPLLTVLSTIMIAATPVFGGHHFSDLIGGAVVAVVSILFVARRADNGSAVPAAKAGL